MDIERIQWWVEAESIKRKIRADRERLERIEMEEKLFCRETKTKTPDKNAKKIHYMTLFATISKFLSNCKQKIHFKQ